MKPAYAVVPVLLLGAFAAVYSTSSAKKEREVTAESARAAARANQAKADSYSGKVFEGRDGRKEAKADIASGTPKFFLYGKTGGDIAERAAVFQQRFGVELDPLAGCIVSEPLVSFADAYNETIRTHIAAKFGTGAFEEAGREAMRRWEAKKKKAATPTPEPASERRPAAAHP